MKIILTGFMYSGKSSVAKQLENKINLKRIEMDNLVLQKSGRKTITDIFENDGEETFRKLEKLVAQNLKGQTNVVISTGGGVGVNEELLNTLKIEGTIIYLHVTFEKILQRMGKHTSRPLMKNRMHAEKLYNTRLPLYREYADIIVKTDNHTIEEVSDLIINELRDDL